MSEIAERITDIGIAIGLAWTPVGGEILFIEATRMPGKGGLILTGSLGDVMKESAHTALSFLRSQAKELKSISPLTIRTTSIFTSQRGRLRKTVLAPA